MAQKPLDRTPTWEAIIQSANLGCGFLMTGRGKFTLVDELKMEEMEIFKWSENDNGYVKSQFKKNESGVRKIIYLHRLVSNCQVELEVDHKNRNRQDNRAENLRICTTSQNRGNIAVTSRNKTSRFKGVCKKPGRTSWLARGRVNGKQKLLGCFKTELEAAQCYNDWAIKAFGEFACLNKI